MKKLVLGILAIITAFLSHAQTVDRCLNGYTKEEATDMVGRFSTHHPSQAFVWFKGSVLAQMYNLLTLENADGVRIYYAYDKTNNKNTVILVPTKYAGLNSQGDKVHQDYFDHQANLALFNTLFADANATGEEGKIIANDPNARLYTHCNDQTCKDCALPANEPHYILHSAAENMVKELQNTPADPLTKSIWYPLCVISGFDLPTYDGMRIYFAKHPASDPYPYSGRESFVLEKTNNHADVYDCSFSSCAVTGLTDEINKMFPLPAGKSKNSLIEKNKVLMKRKAFNKFTRDEGVDNGEQCLYNCDGVTWP